MHSILRDTQFALRTLRRQPTFTVTAVLTLAVAIGANAAVFSVVDAIFLRPVPARDPATLVSVFRTFEDPAAAGAGGGGLLPASYPNYLDFAARVTTLGGLAAEAQGQVSLAGGGEPEQTAAGFVTANYFEVLGLAPVRGRFFLPEENQRGAARQVAVLGEGLWRSRYGGREDLVGGVVTINSRDFEVVGIAPAGFRGLFTLSNQALWLPVESWPLLATGPFTAALEHRGFRLFQMTGRLAPGVDREAAEAELAVIAQRLAEEHPQWNRNRGVRVFSLASGALNPNQRGVFVRAGTIGMGAVALVLIVACANVANLLMARGRGRTRELAIRLSLGAGRARVARQLLTEGLVLSLCGGLAGLLLAGWLLPLLWRLRPPFLQAGHLDLGIDLRVLGYTLVACVLAGILFSLSPVREASRTDLIGAVRTSARTSRSSDRPWGLRHGLVGAQVAFAVVLLVGAGLFFSSLEAAREIDAGFDVGSLGVVSLDAGALGGTADAQAATLERLLESATGTPGVERAAFASVGPLSFGPQLRLFPQGYDEQAPEGTYVSINDVGPGYFETIGIGVLEGRMLDERDRIGGMSAVVVNQTFVERFWPEGSALGRQIRWLGAEQPWVVVGVAEDIKYATLGEEPQPYLYRSLDQFPSAAVTLHLRGDVAGGPSPADLLSAVIPRLKRVAPGLPFVDPLPVPAVIERSLWAGRLGATLLGCFGLVGLLLAVTGLYGVVAQAALARRREVGIRLALGAGRGGVVSLIVRQGMVPVLAGAIAGALLCVPLSRLFSGLLYGGGRVSVLGVLAATTVLGLAALLACAIPALRAARLEPVATLRAE